MCQWTDIDPKTGKVWEPSWQMASTVTPDLIKAYESRRAVGIPSKLITVDAANAFHVVRRSLAHALVFGAMKEAGFQGRKRARVHKVSMGIASLEPVALAILDIARAHGGPALKLAHGNVGKPNEFWQLIVEDLGRIGRICEFEKFVDSAMAQQNVRLTSTATHSGDMMAVGQPFMITVHALAHTQGIVNMEVEFPTIHFNGATGQPTYPPMSSGMLKKIKERKKLIAHVRDLLPANHPLREKGWCALPQQVEALAIEVAVPDKEEAPKKAKKGKK